MEGLLKKTSEIEKLQEEFKNLIQIKQNKTTPTDNEIEELVLDECEL